jgi:pimeloyl-ACP methyl ester carboxylesterase
VAGTARPGVPTVVFESGLGSQVATWNGLQSDIAAVTRTIAYDRAGVGKSDPATTQRTVKQIATELHDLLAKLDAPPPYVLVGHSYGGPIIHTFGAMFPREVVGLVYIDPSDFTQTEADMQAIYAKAGMTNGHDAIASMTKPALAAAPAGLRAEYLEIERVERGGFVEYREAGDPPDVPMSILLAGKREPLAPGVKFPGNADLYFQTTFDQRVEHFSQLTRRSARAHLVLTSASSHFFHVTEPDLVTSEIRAVLSAASPRPELERFVGDYPVAPTFVMTITRDGDKLFVQATRQPKFQLYADSPTVFSLKVVDVKIEFETDPAGKVTGLVFVQNGVRQRAPKTK